MTDGELIQLISDQCRLMLDVYEERRATPADNREYGRRRDLIAQELRHRGLGDPNRLRTLEQWCGRWSSLNQTLPDYATREAYLGEIYGPLVERIQRAARIHDQPTGWALVDRQVDEIRRRLAQAVTVEQFQGVGHLCRETLISLAQEVFDEEQHLIDDVEKVSPTDFKRMLGAYLAVELAGGEHKDARKLANAAFDFANKVQHLRRAGFRDAAMCAESTVAVVNLVAIVSGRRDREPREET